MRVVATTLLCGACATTTTASVVLPATGLLSDGTNTLLSSAPVYQLDTTTPVLTWAPQHTGTMDMDDLTYTVSLRRVGVSVDTGEGSTKIVFEHTFESLEFPEFRVPDGVLTEGTSYELSLIHI